MNYLELINVLDLVKIGYSEKNAERLTMFEEKKSIKLKKLEDKLDNSEVSDKKFVILGSPEGVGPYANNGRNGAYGAWNAFLESFKNNLAPVAENTLILGNIYLADLQRKSEYYDNSREKDKLELRRMVTQIDRRTEPVLRTILEAGLIPIVIGGGHNNAYPLIKESAKLSSNNKISCISLDLHADLRKTDGRHSGNAFSYAFENSLLHSYYIFGLHENYHSDSYYEKVKGLKNKGKINYSTYTQITKKFEKTFNQEMNKAKRWLKDQKAEKIGLEVDLDSVEGIPTSAITEVRVPFTFTQKFVGNITSEFLPLYFNISEGAPDLGKRNSKKVVGDSISKLILSFIGHYSKL